MPKNNNQNFSLFDVFIRSAAYLFLFILPVFIWLHSISHLIKGHIKLIVDAQVCYRYTEYFFHHIGRWVYPLWDPYHAWGRPDDFGVRMIGECNPLTYIISLMRGVGANFSTAYACFYLFYFILGAFGFYFLVKCLYKKFWLAYCAFCLVLLSNLGSNIFNDCLLVLIIVPAIWFYYFFVSFFKEFKIVDWLGLTLAMMIINVTYMPFHFLTSLGIILVCLCAFYPRRVGLCLKELRTFAGKNKIIFALAIVSILLSLLPGFRWFLEARNGDYVVNWRTAGDDPLEMTLATISLSSLIGPNSIRGLWADLDGMDLGLFYAPLFFWLILACGLIVPVRKKGLIFISIAFLIFLISLADFTPLFLFLFKYIFFFRYFRNLHYLVWFAWLAALLFFVDVLAWWMYSFPQQKSKKIIGLLLIVIHSALGVFFYQIRNVGFISYLSLLLNVIFLILWGRYHSKPIVRYGLMAGFFIIIMIQPVSVFQSFRQNTAHYKFTDSQQDNWTNDDPPVFVFERPDYQREVLKPYEAFGALQDTSGFFKENYYGMRWSYFLHEQMPRELLQSYVKNKFILYDDFQCVDETFDDKQHIAEVLSLRSKKALVVCGDDQTEMTKAGPPAPLKPPRVILADGQTLTVRRFDLNEIELLLDVPFPQLFVYNDSYHRKWHLTVDGKPETIYRANVAFKGVWVPAGKHRLRLRYESRLMETFYKLLMIYFLAFFLLLISCYFIRLKKMFGRGLNGKSRGVFH
ncbi:MAG: hypothetical protein K8S27_12045 [Candidatus Omnitrophica bacterium]|nr:hypothetical protein [Candidatus Omnitrophota bacterium]